MPLMRTHLSGARWALAILALTAGCAMRVSGTVIDAATGQPIGGAVLTAEDGRNRMSVTDPLGRYAVKTDWKDTSLTATAPGYQTTTLPVSGTDRYPTADIALQRLGPPGSQPPGSPGPSPPLASAGPSDSETTTGTAAKIRQLQELHAAGLVPDDEYQRTRARLLREM